MAQQRVKGEPTSPDMGLRYVEGKADSPRAKQIKPSTEYAGMMDSEVWPTPKQDDTYVHPDAKKYEAIMEDQLRTGENQEERRRANSKDPKFGEQRDHDNT
jgi:hypothetical protein